MSKPRIIGGSARGRSLDTPRSGTRPSPARLREALFNMLGFEIRGRFLDLYSGSGAVGLEAASRGWDATCVDSSAEATRVIAGNAARLGLRVTARRGDALAFARANPGSYDVVFAAPPYPQDLPTIFRHILASGPALPGGIYLFQHPTTLELNLPATTGTEAEVRHYGSNAVTVLRTRGDSEEDRGPR